MAVAKRVSYRDARCVAGMTLPELHATIGDDASPIRVRLLAHARWLDQFQFHTGSFAKLSGDIEREAADEIERLQAEIERHVEDKERLREEIKILRNTMQMPARQ